MNTAFQLRKMSGGSFVQLTEEISWPRLQNGRTSTKEFLEASRVILKFFDTLGKIYSPVKHDVEGNITKLTRKYLDDPERYMYLEDMIETEISNGENFAADSLLWLKRGLHFICLFLHALVIDHEKNVKNDSLLDNMRLSYELSLKPYHNWVLQKLFVVLSRAAPTRQQLFKSMTSTSPTNKKGEHASATDSKDCFQDIDQEEVIRRVKVFVQGLTENLEAIFDLYLRLQLDTRAFISLPIPASIITNNS